MKRLPTSHDDYPRVIYKVRTKTDDGQEVQIDMWDNNDIEILSSENYDSIYIINGLPVLKKLLAMLEKEIESNNR